MKGQNIYRVCRSYVLYLQWQFYTEFTEIGQPCPSLPSLKLPPNLSKTRGSHRNTQEKTRQPFIIKIKLFPLFQNCFCFISTSPLSILPHSSVQKSSLFRNQWKTTQEFISWFLPKEAEKFPNTHLQTTLSLKLLWNLERENGKLYSLHNPIPQFYLLNLHTHKNPFGFQPEACSFLQHWQENNEKRWQWYCCDNVRDGWLTDGGDWSSCWFGMREEHLHEEADKRIWRGGGAAKGRKPRLKHTHQWHYHCHMFGWLSFPW